MQNIQDPQWLPSEFTPIRDYVRNNNFRFGVNPTKALEAAATKWPRDCRYYDALYMDANGIQRLLDNDTSYLTQAHPWSLDYAFHSGSGFVQQSTHPQERHEEGIFRQSVLDSPLTVVHIRQKRLYLKKNAVSAISVDKPTWLDILERFEILPSWLELLHSNNGGSMSWTSYAPNYETKARGPVAFHIGYKMGDWGNDEIAVYARKDLKAGNAFVLIMGTETCLCRERIYEVLSSDFSTATMFHIAFLVHAATLDLTETIRWEMDYTVQDLESLTGVAALQGRAQPLAPEQLRFNKNLQVATDFTRNITFGSERVRLNFEALLSHISLYEQTCPPGASHAVSKAVLQNLKDSCNFKRELARHQYDQTMNLLSRLRAQAEITKTLMAERDTAASIDIAQATRRDSELMRGIAAVTMIFLPATFVATFFSMVFFQGGDDDDMHRRHRLTVDHAIWLYPAVTVPLTACIAAWYFAWSFGLSWKGWRSRLSGASTPEHAARF